MTEDEILEAYIYKATDGSFSITLPKVFEQAIIEKITGENNVIGYNISFIANQNDFIYKEAKGKKFEIFGIGAIDRKTWDAEISKKQEPLSNFDENAVIAKTNDKVYIYGMPHEGMAEHNKYLYPLKTLGFTYVIKDEGEITYGADIKKFLKTNICTSNTCPTKLIPNKK